MNHSHSAIDIHARKCEPTVDYFEASTTIDEFVALRFEDARGSLTRWEDRCVVLEARASERNTGSVYLSPADARQLAERILAALPDEAPQATEVAA